MTIGILGGGQLGRMIALAGIPLGLSFRFLDPAPDAPAAAVGELIVGDFNHAPTLRRFANGLDAVTFEFENVPVAALERLAALGLEVYPNANSLRTAQDRLLEKQLFERVGLRVPAYAPVDSQHELDATISTIGLPAVLKTRRMGYDGKGQLVLRRKTDIHSAVATLAPTAARGNSPAALILEQFITFEREVSLIAVAGKDGSRAFYPLTENVHREGILRTSRAPAAGVSNLVRTRAQAAVGKIIDTLGYIGTLAVEFFVHDGQLLANEMAPRVHNSGHWTIDAAVTSQFENHLRAVLGWPLGDTSLRSPCVMHNLIGDAPPLDKMLGVEGAHVHLYGKASRPGRKVGHVTCLHAGPPRAPDTTQAAARAIDRLILRSQA